jgi:hypothetical protein
LPPVVYHSTHDYTTLVGKWRVCVGLTGPGTGSAVKQRAKDQV